MPSKMLLISPGPSSTLSGSAGGLYGLAGSQTGGLFVDLYRGLIAVNLDDLANQTLVADAAYVKHIGVTHSLGDNQRPGNFFYGTFAHVFSPAFSLVIIAENDVGANSLLHRAFYAGDPTAGITGHTRDQNNGGQPLGAVTVQLLADLPAASASVI